MSGLNDELDENIILCELNVMVGEWIPFGANQIVALNEKLGSTDRCQGGLLSERLGRGGPGPGRSFLTLRLGRTFPPKSC